MVVRHDAKFRVCQAADSLAQAGRDDHDRGDNISRYSIAAIGSSSRRHSTVRDLLHSSDMDSLADTTMDSGIILIAGLGILATYTGFVIGQFKLAYPHVHNMADAGEVMLGPVGREVFGAAQMLFLIFIMGSHILTFSIMMNVLTIHGTCTIVFGVVGLIVCMIFTMPRTLHKVSYMAIVSFISIIAAVIITMVGVGVERPGNGKVDVTEKSNFPDAFLAVTNIIFAYAGQSSSSSALVKATQ